MKITIWIVQLLVAVIFLISGITKLFGPYEELLNTLAWVEDVGEIQLRIIASLELLGVIGLILPMVLKKYRILVPVAASGLALVMISAMALHILRNETIIPNLIIMSLAIFVVYGRRQFFSFDK